ncbi:MAG TPA: hypothetical protein RMH26_03990 [Polyangiaceae bacterium LLY-WYZ-15_(1-7)]|nr:hypothetical protein [Polyangiaceae bacterium LLY-WYZ-15_(1-7)]
MFDEERLTAAFAQWIRDDPTQDISNADCGRIMDFLYSDACADLGLRRGGSPQR